ncbi:MAG TPA: inositol-3-phosphate synthase [Bdellovibrionota bacterium]|nr:inositol-3-phosphate synthase [Bdellovibrionota bacterium]
MSTTQEKVNVSPADGKLGVLIPGLGAVSTTFIIGVKAILRGLGEPIGSLTQMATIRLGKRTDKRSPLIKDFVPLTKLQDLEFGAWDIFDENCYDVAVRSNVIFKQLVEQVKDDIASIKPWKAVFDPAYVSRLKGTYVKTGKTKYDLARQVMDDIARFKEEKRVSRIVMIWCGSTEAYLQPSAVHQTIEAFEKGLKNNDPNIPPSMIYAYAALQSGVPYANGAPNLTVDIPAMIELAKEKGVPVSGKDYKTGQTLMKTIIAPGLKARMIGINGWFSSNILGNRDGEVLDAPENFKTKEESKLSVLESILQPHLYPSLYGDLYHKVRINYYPPRGDNKESWDNIDLTGWLNYKMQLKINFLCKDSILAAPIVLDLVLLMDFAKRCGFKGIQEWLSFYYKSPMVAEGLYPEHDLFIQMTKLKNTLRYIQGEDLITHLGREYYEA